MKLTNPEIVDEYLLEQKSYSSDFKALVLRIYVREGENIAKTVDLTGVPQRTLYAWIWAWNEAKEDKKKL
jgi:transposase-like protein